jgi:diguanylate cyclase (GGDEF)-like protein
MSETDAPVAVLMIDLDRFKLVNDTHGHAVGDEVLVRCAELLQQATRPADLVVRLGGDEFVVVLLDGRGRPEQVGDRIRRAAHEHRWAATAADLTMTVSVGVAAGHGRELAQLVERADEALYAAKRAGRDRVITAG